ncbi:hypothetical protein AWV79_01920 [Cupriavidus sp. UYMMa02A]|nr:hypothetical protein AWV79_01920 [Cupriavidus sp. UYMMa02A]
MSMVVIFTEFATIRIADPLVIYRSYLWMAGSFAALPWLFQRLTVKHIAIGTVVIAALLIFPTLLRLQSFSSDWLLWNDAARLIEGRPVIPGMERVISTAPMPRYAWGSTLIAYQTTTLFSNFARQTLMHIMIAVRRNYSLMIFLAPNLILSMR